MKTTLVNLHDYKDSDVVYIDRRNKLLGNPYPMGKYSQKLKRRMTRKDVIMLCKKRFHRLMKKDPEFRRAVEDLRGKKIACWCTPLSCHGDTYIEYLENSNVST